jgi:hypothetical protein
LHAFLFGLDIDLNLSRKPCGPEKTDRLPEACSGADQGVHCTSCPDGEGSQKSVTEDIFLQMGEPAEAREVACFVVLTEEGN